MLRTSPPKPPTAKSPSAIIPATAGASSCPDRHIRQAFSLWSRRIVLGKPVIAVNAALVWRAYRANGLDDRIYGCGSLPANR